MKDILKNIDTLSDVDTKEIKEAVSKANFPSEAKQIINYLCDKIDEEKFHYDGLSGMIDLIGF